MKTRGSRSRTLGLLGLILLAGSIGNSAASRGRWVVDVVLGGDAKSELEHDFAAEGPTAGAIDGRPFRQAASWLRYTMRVFDDSEVTIACTFRGSAGRKINFDLLVDGHHVLTHRFESSSDAPVVLDFHVPLRFTEGKSRISVTLHGVDGPTPGLMELSTVQEHLEKGSGRIMRSVSEH